VAGEQRADLVLAGATIKGIPLDAVYPARPARSLTVSNHAAVVLTPSADPR
jgi:hypothetical protein